MTPEADDSAIPIDALPIGQHISRQARGLFRDGYPREAVRHESQRLLNRLKERADLPNLDGQQLVERVFSDQKPILVLNPRSTPLERDLQAGLRHLTLGVARGVRNVLTHDIEHEVSAEEAAIWLGLIGLLHQQLDAVYPAEGEPDDPPSTG